MQVLLVAVCQAKEVGLVPVELVQDAVGEHSPFGFHPQRPYHCDHAAQMESAKWQLDLVDHNLDLAEISTFHDLGQEVEGEVGRAERQRNL